MADLFERAPETAEALPGLTAEPVALLRLDATEEEVLGVSGLLDKAFEAVVP